jgi:hypothetical protein
MYVKNKEIFHLRLEVKYGFQYHNFHKTQNAQKYNFIGQKIWQVLTENYIRPEVTYEWFYVDFQ